MQQKMTDHIIQLQKKFCLLYNNLSLACSKTDAKQLLKYSKQLKTDIEKLPMNISCQDLDLLITHLNGYIQNAGSSIHDSPSLMIHD